MDGIVFELMEDAKRALKEARANWEIAMLNGGELRGKELIDYHHAESNKEDENINRRKKKY